MCDEAVDDLVLAIQQGKCVLFTGPDLAQVPLEKKDPNTISITELISSQLHEALLRPEDVSPDSGLAHVSQIYLWEDRHTRGRNKLLRKVSGVYDQFKEATTELHCKIAKIPFRLCISTSLDDFLLNAYRKETDKKPYHDFFDFSEPKSPPTLPVSPRKPLIYKLNGSLKRPQSLVVTEDDLITYLIQVVKTGFPPNLSQLIQDPSVVFLFLGFGLYHWHLRILLRVLDETCRRENPSFASETENAISQRTSYTVGRSAEEQVFYRLGHKILFLDSDPDEIVTKLLERFESGDPVNHVSERPVGSVRESPSVFLSYTRRDSWEEQKEECPISTIEERLSREGFKVWRDKSAIRGGDKWEELIRDALKMSSYFIFVQSENTEPPEINRANPIESFWRTEIDAAVERSKRFPKTFRFLIPVRIENCEKVKELRPFQSIDLFEPDGMDALIQAMKDDWKLRVRESN